MENNMKRIKSIRDIRIGDTVIKEGHDQQMFVVGLYAESGTLGVMPADFTGGIVCDFADNPGDVFEFNLAEKTLYKVNE
jgi:hypothetical protein